MVLLLGPEHVGKMKGRKNTKYFFEVEKIHFNSKTIRNLKIDDNTTLNTDEENLNEAKRFYQTLYTLNNNFSQFTGENLFFDQNNQCQISDAKENLVQAC